MAIFVVFLLSFIGMYLDIPLLLLALTLILLVRTVIVSRIRFSTIVGALMTNFIELFSVLSMVHNLLRCLVSWSINFPFEEYVKFCLFG